MAIDGYIMGVGNMQLLYFWFTSTYPETIRKGDGNLSPAYDFWIEETSVDKYTLHKSREWQGHDSVFATKNSCIENISALVGANGAGKTTILFSLMEMNKWAKAAAERPKQGTYGRLCEYVLVFGDGQHLHVYTSLPDLDCKSVAEDNANLSIHAAQMPNGIPFESHTVLYLTNSAYVPYINDSVVDEKGVHVMAVTPSTIERLARKFYDRLLGLEGKAPITVWSNVHTIAAQMIRMYKTAQDFQQLVDVLYWQDMGYSKPCNKHEGKTGTELGVWIEPIAHIVNDYLEQGRDIGGLRRSACFLLPVDEGGLPASIDAFLPNESWQIRTLYYNLVCELLWIVHDARTKIPIDRVRRAVQRLSRYSKTMDGKGQVTNNVKDEVPLDDEATYFWPSRNETSSIAKLKAWITTQLKRSELLIPWLDSDMIQYFIQAQQDINSYRRLLTAGVDVAGDYNLISQDLGGWFGLTKENSMVVFQRNSDDYRKEGTDAYGKLLNFVAKQLKADDSFILRYLNISKLKMSSGERAFQNLFSWLAVVPRMLARQKQGKNWSFCDNLLVMIDEADLYMHPQWQKSLVRILKGHLERCYKNKKVQVIITTHSPICLSDFPRENCIYIDYDRLENKRVILQRNTSAEKQTFGRDIYALLREGFFLSGSPMGDFADEYMCSLLRDIYKIYQKIIDWEKKIIGQDKTHSSESCNLNGLDKKLNIFEQRAQVIGNVLLRKKIDYMLKEMKEWKQYVWDKRES